LKPVLLPIIDPCQFGFIPGSSTTLALTSMFHHWLRATDGTQWRRQDLFWGGGKSFECRRHEPTRGVRGYAPRENFEFWVSKTAFPAFWRHFKRNIKVLINHFF
jgi:hypothetical protein